MAVSAQAADLGDVVRSRPASTELGSMARPTAFNADSRGGRERRCFASPHLSWVGAFDTVRSLVLPVVHQGATVTDTENPNFARPTRFSATPGASEAETETGRVGTGRELRLAPCSPIAGRRWP